MRSSWKTLPTLFGALLLLTSANASAASIVGAWYMTNAGQAQSTVVFTFLPDGRFMLIEDGNPVADPTGQDGLEKGTYTWNSGTGAIAVNTAINTNGEWGLCNVPTGSTTCPTPPGATATATASALTFTVPGEGSFDAPRVFDPASPIVGAWYFSSGPAPQNLTVVAFLPDGRFMIGIDPPAFGFIEFGNYTYDPLTGTFSATLGTSNAPPGSSVNLPTFTSANISNGNLVLSSNAGTLALADVTVPEPRTLALVAVALAGLLTRRRR